MAMNGQDTTRRNPNTPARNRPRPTRSPRGVWLAIWLMVGATLLAMSTGIPPAAAATRRDVASTEAPAKTGRKAVRIGEAIAIDNDARVDIEAGVSTASVNDAMGLLTVDWKHLYPGWTLRFRSPRKGLLALTLPKEKRIDVYVRKNRTAMSLAHDVAHELGHAADVTYLVDVDRYAYLRNRGLVESTSWWTCNSCGDMNVGAGDFAETFALIVSPKFRFFSELAPEPNQEALTEIVAGLPDEIRSMLRPS